jgi:hypothetical protein
MRCTTRPIYRRQLRRINTDLNVHSITEPSLEHLLLRVRPPPDLSWTLKLFCFDTRNVQNIYVGIANAVLPHQNQKNPWQISLIECRPEQRDRLTTYLIMYCMHLFFYAYSYVIVSWTLTKVETLMISLAAAHILVWTVHPLWSPQNTMLE